MFYYSHHEHYFVHFTIDDGILQYPNEKYIFHENLQQYFLSYSQQSETPPALHWKKNAISKPRILLYG